MKCFIDALELDYYSTAAHCYASEGYRRLGNIAKSKEHRDIALQLDPEGAQQFLELADQQFTRVIQRDESSRSPTKRSGD
jgi:Tfp pilus assembly protein PilF